MELLRDTPMTAAVVPDHLGPDRPIALVIVKAAFELWHRQVATLADEQPALAGDELVDDDPRGAAIRASDFAPVKARGELYVTGACHPPGGRAAISAVAVEVGGVRKAVGVFGERTWKRGLLGSSPSEPAPFSSMPLTFDRAFGGARFADNPFGRGLDRAGPLPNLEDPRRPIASVDDRPTPMALGPLAPTHPSRLRYAGTYDERWRRERFPFWPEDFDVRYFSAAPTDQRRAKGYWTGDEEIAVKNLHPERSFVRSKLPGLVPRAYAQRADGGPLERVGLALDTVVIDGDRMEAHATWRGSIPLRSASLDELHRMFVFHESARTATSPAAAMERMSAALIVAQLEAAGFRPRNAAQSATTATAILQRYAKGAGLASPTLAAAAALAERTLLGGTVLDASSLAGEAGTAEEPSGAPSVGAGVASARAGSAADGSADPPIGSAGGVPGAHRSDDAPADAAQASGGSPEPSDEATPSAPEIPQTLSDLVGVTLADVEAAFEQLGLDAPPQIAAALASAAPSTAMGEAAVTARLDALLAKVTPAPAAPGAPGDVRARALEELGLAPDAGPEAFLATIDARLASIRTPAAPDPLELERGLRAVGASADTIARLRGHLSSLGGPSERGDAASVPSPDAERDAARVGAESGGAGADEAHAPSEAQRDEAAAVPTAGPSSDGTAAPPTHSAGEATAAGGSTRASRAEEAGAGPAADLSGAPSSTGEARDTAGRPATPQSAGADLRARIQREHAMGIAFDGDASGADLAGMGLAGWRAPGAVLARARFEGATLAGADLSSASLAGADLSGADLSGADLRRADLSGANLAGADLGGAQLADASLDGAALDEANLAGADLSGASLRGASLLRARAAAVVLRGADLFRANLSGIAADGADLSDATLHGADARDAILTRANLGGLRAKRGARFDGADLRHATAPRARFAGSSLRGAKLGFGDLTRADFSDADLTDAAMAGCALRNARFDRARMDRALATQCDLMAASLRGASLIQADLRGSSLHAAELFEAETAGARLEGADVSSTKLGGA